MNDGRRTGSTNVRAYALSSGITVVVLGAISMATDVVYPVGFEGGVTVLVGTIIAWLLPSSFLEKVPLRRSPEK